MNKKKSKNYLFIFALLMIIFLTPLISAFLLYKQNPLWIHYKTINKGYLISSNLNFQQIKLTPDRTTLRAFKNNWFIFYLTDSPCQQLCQKNLHTMRQITLALGKYRQHVNYGLILARANSGSDYPFIHKDTNLLNYKISKPQFKKIFSVLNIKNHNEAYFIADPRGKIILYYPNTASGEDIYQDLMRLLTISTTG